MTEAVQAARDLVTARLGRERWILCADAAATFTPFIPRLLEAGAPRPLLLAGSAGTGSLPGPEDCELVLLETGADTMLGGIREYHAALRDLPPWALERIDRWDPDGTAWVMQTFLDTRHPVAGREPWGSRPPEWLALEDKMVVDALWDAIGVPRAPSEIVAATVETLTAASARMDAGSGVVWTADNREGWHGGAEYSRHVSDPADAAGALEFMAWHAGSVRVMPFLDGIPCAIHGMVFPDTVITFRPVEMVVFRQPGSDRFRYSGAASSWDPPLHRRQEMRRVAQSVGTYLRQHHGFRGAFTVDGVMTEDGFRPTELNPRYGAGILLVSAAADVPTLAISRMLIEGEPVDLDPAELEHAVVEAADRSRVLHGMAITETPRHSTEEVRVRWDGERVVMASDAEANATLTTGPASLGSFTRFALDAAEIPVGSSAAPIVAAGLRHADELWGLGIGELIPATDLDRS